MAKKLKVALVHDFLREYGGAERVVEALHEMFPEAPLYTAFVDREALGIHWQRFKDWDIRESRAAGIPFIKKLYSPLRLLSSYFFESFDLHGYDVVISSTNMYMAKAVITHPPTVHICYCHTPPRSLYGYTTMTDWKKNPLVRIFGELINFRMRQIDYVTAQRPDVFVANSEEVQSRIKKFYRRESEVIYPPVTMGEDPSTSVGMTNKEKDYYLYVNRLAFSKHPELAVAVCTHENLPLKVVGTGAMLEGLKESAGQTVEFLGAVSDEKLNDLYTGAKALLYPVKDEDFGIVPMEAMGHGVPVVAHASGGPLETIIDGKTGIFFSDLSETGLSKAIKKFESAKFDTKFIQKHAQQFSSEKFKDKINKLINDSVMPAKAGIQSK
ncbi:MAG TPA: glycosyltransferase [Patescibacteria group bacterium]|nr:glycosyltransferase [Patescibacteria group bacterium]